MTSREVRDAVHGLVTLKPHEWGLIDTHAFQRLRGVQQLAMTHLVYPGARHSRFEHCIGACHVAGRMAESLQERAPAEMNEDRVDRIRTAALAHDIGHGPFSHVSEFVFEELTGFEHVHERISATILRHDEQVRSALGTDRADWAADLLAGDGHGSRRSVDRDIVAGPADIDKLDYLLRDSHFCGVNYGRYDLDKIIESARLITRKDGDYLAYHPDGVYAIEEMLLARYHMHRQVYGHKTRVATDLMLMRAMLLGAKAGQLPESVFKPTTFDAAFVKDYLTWDDRKVVDVLSDTPSSDAGQLMRALTARRLFKRVAVISQEELTARGDKITAGYAMKPTAEARQKRQEAAEAAIAEAAGVDPLWVNLHWEDLANPVTAKDEARVSDKEVLLTDSTGTRNAASFYDESEIFRGESVQARRRIAVYIGSDGSPSGSVRPDTDTVKDKAIDELISIGEEGGDI